MTGSRKTLRQHMTRAFMRGMWLSISLSWVLLMVTTFGPDAIYVSQP